MRSDGRTNAEIYIREEYLGLPSFSLSIRESQQESSQPLPVLRPLQQRRRRHMSCGFIQETPSHTPAVGPGTGSPHFLPVSGGSKQGGKL